MEPGNIAVDPVEIEAIVVGWVVVSGGIQDAPEPAQGGEAELEVALLIRNGGDMRFDDGELKVLNEMVPWEM